MEQHLEHVVHDAHHGQGDGVIIPLPGAVVKHHRQDQQHRGNHEAQGLDDEAVGHQEEAVDDGAQLLFKSVGAEGVRGNHQFLLLPGEQALQKQADGEDEHAADGDSGQGLGAYNFRFGG